MGVRIPPRKHPFRRNCFCPWMTKIYVLSNYIVYVFLICAEKLSKDIQNFTYPYVTTSDWVKQYMATRIDKPSDFYAYAYLCKESTGSSIHCRLHVWHWIWTQLGMCLLTWKLLAKFANWISRASICTAIINPEIRVCTRLFLAVSNHSSYEMTLDHLLIFLLQLICIRWATLSYDTGNAVYYSICLPHGIPFTDMG